MYVTWLDNNSWLWEIAGKRILVDPWLLGPLVFSNIDWLFRGEKSAILPLPKHIDMILLSQGLEDHAHPQTLQALDKSIPVVGSPNAAGVARKYGFTQVTALDHGQTFTADGWQVKAVPGAPIGPQLLENGYVLTEAATGFKLFYEPHGYHQPALKEQAPIDVVITPMMDLSLPIVGPIIRGRKSARELADWLQPQVMLPTADTGETRYEGFLVALLKRTGNVEKLRRELQESGKTTQVIEPVVGDRIELSLTPQTEVVSA